MLTYYGTSEKLNLHEPAPIQRAKKNSPNQGLKLEREGVY